MYKFEVLCMNMNLFMMNQNGDACWSCFSYKIYSVSYIGHKTAATAVLLFLLSQPEFKIHQSCQSLCAYFV